MVKVYGRYKLTSDEIQAKIAEMSTKQLVGSYNGQDLNPHNNSSLAG